AWLWNNADNDDVILAAGGCEWTPALGIASATTGVPAILGWAGHERQWRIGDEEALATLPERTSAITTLFANPDDPVADQYDVTLMFIGRAATVGPADPN